MAPAHTLSPSRPSGCPPSCPGALTPSQTPAASPATGSAQTPTRQPARWSPARKRRPWSAWEEPPHVPPLSLCRPALRSHPRPQVTDTLLRPAHWRGCPRGAWGPRESALSLRSPAQAESLTHVEILVGDFHGIGHAGLFLGLHQAATQRDDTLRKNQNSGPQPPPSPGHRRPLGAFSQYPGVAKRLKARSQTRTLPEGHRRDTAWEGARVVSAPPHKTCHETRAGHQGAPSPLGTPSPIVPTGPSRTVSWGEAPHLGMDVEVFIGFKALFFALRVVKKEALFDDEKPIVGGGEEAQTGEKG